MTDPKRRVELKEKTLDALVTGFLAEVKGLLFDFEQMVTSLQAQTDIMKEHIQKIEARLERLEKKK